MLSYPAKFEAEEEGGFTVTFRDVPEAITCGDTLAEAQFHAADALETALSFYTDRNAPFPTASAALPDEQMISVA